MVSCQQKTAKNNLQSADSTSSDSTTLYAYPGDYKMDYPKDVRCYFDSLYKYGGLDVCVHGDILEDSMQVWRSVDLLSNYAKGQRKFFPKDDIKKACNILAFQAGYLFSHGVLDTLGKDHTIALGEVFLFRLLEQAVRLTPQIDYLADSHSPDNQVGVICYREWSQINPLYSFLIYKTPKGNRIQMIGHKGMDRVDKLFQLKDNAGNVYYLSSCDLAPIYFSQHLYWMKNGEMKLICYNNDYQQKYEDGCEIIFNPRTCCWNYCKKSGAIYKKKEGTKTLKLILQGDKSKFVWVN